MALATSRILSGLMLVGGLSVAQHAASAPLTVAMTVDGAKQGKFKGDSTQRGGANQINVTGFTFEMKSPRDAATGQASGKRQHSPLIITHDLGASSPQFFEALVTNEVLHNVTIEVKTQALNGASVVSYRVTLTNASVASVQQQIAPGATGGLVQSEIVQLTYQAIEEEDLAAKTIASDNWSALAP